LSREGAGEEDPQT
jgi:beta-galactosidase